MCLPYSINGEALVKYEIQERLRDTSSLGPSNCEIYCELLCKIYVISYVIRFVIYRFAPLK
jgi:hypothetical protein